MAFDGMMLRIIKNDLQSKLIPSRTDKIYQPSREELVISFRTPAGNERLYISASPMSARIHLTDRQIENPMQPPMFCMLMRKILYSSKLLCVRQLACDRVLYLDFETVNELGDTVTVTLAVEIMGRHSNIILIGNNGKIIDSIRHVDETMSSVREVLPGRTYCPPPLQDKLVSDGTNTDAIIERIIASHPSELSRAILDSVMGMSPLIAREVEFYVGRGATVYSNKMTLSQTDRLRFVLNSLSLSGPQPTVIMTAQGVPKDISYIRINQYGNTVQTRQYENLSQMLDSFYYKRDNTERMKQKSGDLLKLIITLLERQKRKLEAQRDELIACADKEQFKKLGDLLSANIYAMEKGMNKIEVDDFYSDTAEKLSIKLDPSLTPSQNAQYYYKQYRKSDNREKKLRVLIREGESEEKYIESVFDELSRAATAAELSAIREELYAGGYVKRVQKKQPKQPKITFLRYLTEDGYEIRAGKNNVENDRLTLRESRNYDMWFHTHNIPGSHVVVISKGEDFPESVLTTAAIIAATNSHASDSGSVPVDYTIIKNVKKPVGAKPGMVIYSTYKTAFVTPDRELEQRLLLNH